MNKTNVEVLEEKIARYKPLAQKIVAKKLRAIRKKRGLSQSKAAEKCAMPWKTYGRIERCEENFTMLTILRICAGLELSVYDLLGEFVFYRLK